MKRILNSLIITLTLFLSQMVFPQTVYTVEVKSFSFTPAELTIKVGDTVKWTNILGFHNVVADDNSFTSGPASGFMNLYSIHLALIVITVEYMVGPVALECLE